MSPPLALPGYRDLSEVARGVYRAWQPDPGRPVAIKVLRLADPGAVAAFEREVEITAALGEHPHIVGVLGRGIADGRPYLVMEFYQRGSLHDQLRSGGPLPVGAVVAAGGAIADALAFAHSRGVLHGDVKPQNILLGGADSAIADSAVGDSAVGDSAVGDSYVLADFGLARRVVAGLAAADEFSYRHASPQVLDGQPPSAADDVYSLGSTLYTLLDGRAPFAAPEPAADSALGYLRRARTEEPRPLERADLPAPLVEVIERCLARSAADRYPDAAALRAALAAIPVRPAALVARASDAVPRQLPADVPDFTGRADQLRVLDDLLPGPAVAALVGTGGVGKTALAVHWAHTVAGAFPDGQLFANLRGYHPGEPADPVEVLAQLLRALGVAPQQVPTDPDERAALYRSTLAQRRVLLLLDNAAGADQVRPLLPGAAGCLVLVTGRGRLGGLAAREGARRISLDVLSAAESSVLLGRVLGGGRVAAEPRAAADIAALCGFLPVALRVAAANLADRPQQTLREYASTLRSGNRLSLLSIDGDDAVRGTFDLSYQRLEPAAQRLFRLLGLFPGHDIGVLAAAALAGQPVPDARRLLGVLAGAYLIQETTPARYQVHELLRAHAADRLASEDGGAERGPALIRLLDWYRHAVDTAVPVARPYHRGLPLAVPAPVAGAVTVAGFADAVAFLDQELPNLVAAVRLAAAEGLDAYAWQLPHLLWRYLELRGCLDDWYSTQQLAITAARRAGHRAGEAVTLHSLAVAHRRLGRPAEAMDHDCRALAIQRELGDQAGQAATLNSIGVTHINLGDYALAGADLGAAAELFRQVGDGWGEAVVLGNLGAVCRRLGHHAEGRRHLERALELFRRLGDRRNEAGTLGNLGLLLRLIGDYAGAASHIQPAIELYAQVGDPMNEARAMGNLGTVYARLDQLDQAADQLRRAHAIFRQLGERRGEAEVLGNLGAVYEQLGRFAQAAEYHRDALALARDTGDRNLESEMLNDFGATCRSAGEDAEAVRHHRDALALAQATGNRYEQARAHEGIARAAASADHLRRALALYTELGVPEAAELARALGRLDQLAGR